MSNIDRVADLWASDADFRESFRKDPAEAIAARGISLTSEELSTLNGLQLAGLSDAELEARVSKYHSNKLFC